MEKKKYLFRELVVDSRTGLNPRKNFKLGHGDNYYITIKDIHDGEVVITDKTERIDDNAMKIINKRSRLKVGDVLFSSIGRIGETAIIKEEPKNWNINESVFAFTVNKDLITPEFFRWMFKAPRYKNEIQRESTGSTFVSIKMNKLNEMEFEVPLVDEQMAIVESLENISASILNCNKRIAALDEMIKSRFIEMFGTINLFEEKAEWEELGTLSDIVTGTTPSTSEKDNWDGEVLWITPAEMSQDTFFVFDTARKITERGRKSKSLEIMPINTVLLSTRAPIGKVGIVGTPMTCNQGFKNFVCGQKLNHLYLYTLLKHNTEYLNSKGSGTTFPELSKTNVSKIRIPVPLIDKQKEFANFVLNIEKLKQIVVKELKSVEELLNSKIDYYFGI